MKKLNDILKGCDVIQVVGNSDKNISALQFDSRQVENGNLFIAVSGTQVDGHDYIEKSIELGAVAVVCEVLPEKQFDDVCFVQVSNSAFVLGEVSSNFYDNPSSRIQLVGVTGTNGKTTIATLLYNLFQKLGYKSGLLSTVKNCVGGRVIASTHTTPDAIQLNSLLNEMVEEGCDYCFMEVSSHSIVQGRVSGLDFKGGVFTNLTHDHLDYHKTFDEYLKAKKLFFDNLSKDAFALTNGDDKNGKVMLQNTVASKKYYALKSMADFKCKILESHFDGMMLNMDDVDIWTKFIGGFNAYNLLAVYSTAILLGQQKHEVLTALTELSSVDGRFEYIRSNDGITAVVDYAHTPDALLNVLKTISELRTRNEQVITVVGAGGDRDKSKRPLMAKIAAEMSDKVILTSDNPRTEKPEAILLDMEIGVEPQNKRKVITIVDRKEAIKTSCMLATSGDIILVAGKGHEDYQEINGVKYHFDDKEIIKEIFNEII